MTSLFRVRTAITGGSGGDQVSTMYFEDSGSLTAQDAATAVYNFWHGNVGAISDQLHFQVEPTVYNIHVETGEATGIESVTTASVAGNASGDPLPWSTQWVMRWNTGTFIAGRQVLGHTFLPGATEGSNSSGVPDGASKSGWDSAAATLNGSSSANLMIYSRKNKQAVNVLSGNTWAKWGVLRSRRD